MAKQPYYILFSDEKQDVNLDFKPVQVDIFDQMWKEGHSIAAIAFRIKRKKVEITLLAMDREMIGAIKPRTGGLNGSIPFVNPNTKIVVGA
ncbi:hypothetical protein BK128_09615 [Viridibacillus sp. FSL H7-0596]|uniref:hypothetical protein n=1 Tax=Viridibacillus sp. FSL H7-0596 TaxID=1928923 RepID=UPI00096E57F8|nr:hypothetical protein [Viridibacillus sp. FSL H7-0596]OMC86913.1 hypothetical protein BK128_09615 [Viridibacillus sp. FSL H7-0596]